MIPKKIKKYYDKLTDIKFLVDNVLIPNQTAVGRKLNIDNVLISELIKAKVLYKDPISNSMAWNYKIPVSETLATTMMNKCVEYHRNRKQPKKKSWLQRLFSWF